MMHSILLNAAVLLGILGSVFSSAGTDPSWIVKKDEFSDSVECVGVIGGVLNCISSNVIKEGPNAGLFKNGVLYDRELPVGKTIIKFTIVKGSAIDIGITDKSKFDKNALGLFYEGRGRLSDGQNGIIYTAIQNGSFVRRGIMVDEYGPELKTGDVILLTSIISENSVQLYFTVNGVSLGEAFDIPRKSLDSKLFPVVKVPVNDDSVIHLEYVTESESPLLTRAPEKHLDALDGRYSYVSGYVDNPKNRSVHLKFTKSTNVEEEDTIIASIDIINTLSFQLKRIGNDGKRWLCSNGVTSLVGGPPEEMLLESKFNNFLRGEQLSFIEEGDNFLIFKRLSGGELKWERLHLVPQIITFNPFEE